MGRTVVLVIPSEWVLTSNRRRPRREHNRLNAYIRDLATTEARRLKLEPLVGRQHCTATLYFRVERRRDPNNWAPTTKPLIDGLVRAGFMVDDNSRHLLGPDHRAVVRAATPADKLVVELEFVPCIDTVITK